MRLGMISDDGMGAAELQSGVDYTYELIEKVYTISKRGPWSSVRGYELIGGLMTDVDVRQYLVRCSPFFPDAPFAESVVTFKVDVVRQFVDAKRHKEQAEALGNRANCWIIDNITPGFGEWEVKDPISADRCPDFFKPPKRSAED